MIIKFTKRFRDYNKGDKESTAELAALYEVDEQVMLTRLLALDAIEFPGQTRLVKPTQEAIAKKAKAIVDRVKKSRAAKAKARKASMSEDKPKTAKKTAKSLG